MFAPVIHAGSMGIQGLGEATPSTAGANGHAHTLLSVKVENGGSGYTAGAATVDCTGTCAAGMGATYDAPTATCVGTGTVTSIPIVNAGKGLNPANPPVITCPGAGGSGLQTVALLSGEGGMYLEKSCSECININGGTAPQCFQGKYKKLSTLNAGYGKTATGGTLADAATGDVAGVDVNDCSTECSSSGCDLNNIPTACKNKWGPSGHQYLQDPDKTFRIIAIRATPTTGDKVSLATYIDCLLYTSPSPRD